MKAGLAKEIYAGFESSIYVPMSNPQKRNFVCEKTNGLFIGK